MKRRSSFSWLLSIIELKNAWQIAGLSLYRDMNKLSTQKCAQIIEMLVEGMSMQATSRVTDVSINTVTKLMIAVGEACAAWHDKTVRNVTVSKVQCDEIWAFCCAREKT